MRLGVQAGAAARGLQRRRDHRRGRTLSARSADVNRRIRAMRIAELAQKGAHAVELVGGPRETVSSIVPSR